MKEYRENRPGIIDHFGMLSYLQGSVRTDISMEVHQCARFCNDPKLSHERALNRIVKYIIRSLGNGLIYKPDKDKGIECYVDAEFSGCWNSEDPSNPANIMSRTGYAIMYAGFPVVWVSKLQTEIA